MMPRYDIQSGFFLQNTHLICTEYFLGLYITETGSLILKSFFSYQWLHKTDNNVMLTSFKDIFCNCFISPSLYHMVLCWATINIKAQTSRLK